MTDDMVERPWFSPLLNKIADIAGDRAALLIGREKACQVIYIPKTFDPDHWLTRLVGEEAARVIVLRLSGERLDIPPALSGQLRRRRLAIAEMTAKGYSINRTTRLLGVSRTTVKNHRRRIRENDGSDDDQGSLF